MDIQNITSKHRRTHIQLSSRGSFLRTEHILGQKPNLYKFKKNEITPCALPYYGAIKLKLTGKKNSSKYLVMAIKQLVTQ